MTAPAVELRNTLVHTLAEATGEVSMSTTEHGNIERAVLLIERAVREVRDLRQAIADEELEPAKVEAATIPKREYANTKRGGQWYTVTHGCAAHAERPSHSCGGCQAATQSAIEARGAAGGGNDGA